MVTAPTAPSAERTFVPPRTRYNCRAGMRDGVTLSVDVYLPGEGPGPWPTLLRRTPYIKAEAEKWIRWAAELTQRGYAVAFQDVRGRGDSEGLWTPFRNEFDDGYDSVEWTADQEWCDGNVGMMGISYEGFTPWAAARERPPHLKAIATMAGMGRWHAEWPTMFGCFMTFAVWWIHYTDGATNQPYVAHLRVPDWPTALTHVPLRDALSKLGRGPNAIWDSWLEHSSLDEFWDELSFETQKEPPNIPALHMTGWFDGDQWGQFHHWRIMAERSTAQAVQELIVGPWDHGGVMVNKADFDCASYGDDATLDMLEEHVSFFDKWLKSGPVPEPSAAPVRYFTMGTNRWHRASHWPPAEVLQKDLFLHSLGNAVENKGLLTWDPASVPEPSDSYTYDPDNPTPSAADFEDLPESSPESRPVDIAFFQDRSDVLVYDTDVLQSDLNVTGHPKLILFAASDRVDTDWHLTLCDVMPDGRAIRLSDAAMRAGFRDGMDREFRALPIGEVQRYEIEFRAISNTFRAGHRLRLTVASASFPWHARNPNTGAPLGDDSEILVAVNTVHHSPSAASHLLLPCIDDRQQATP